MRTLTITTELPGRTVAPAALMSLSILKLKGLDVILHLPPLQNDV